MMRFNRRGALASIALTPLYAVGRALGNRSAETQSAEGQLVRMYAVVETAECASRRSGCGARTIFAVVPSHQEAEVIQGRLSGDGIEAAIYGKACLPNKVGFAYYGLVQKALTDPT